MTRSQREARCRVYSVPKGILSCNAVAGAVRLTARFGANLTTYKRRSVAR